MASTGRNTTFILLIMLSIVVFLFLNMVLGSVRIPMSAVWHIFTGTGDEPQTWQNIIWKSRFPQALTPWSPEQVCRSVACRCKRYFAIPWQDLLY